MIFDIDGVLADMGPFEHLISADRSRDKRWKQFHHSFAYARPNKAGLITANSIYHDLDIDLAYSTTRPEQYARGTLRWFEDHDVPMGPIQFRHFVRDGPRPAIEVKLRHWWKWQSDYGDVNPVLGWIDDDADAVQALRKQGCAAWTVRELRRSAQKRGSLKAALEAGPIPKEIRSKNAAKNYPQWRQDEDLWQSKRRDWWEREKRRQRRRRAEEHALRQRRR